jgi:hypothetical protein
VFFLATNILVTFGVVLLISQEGQARVRKLRSSEPGAQN